MTDLCSVRIDRWLWAARFYKTRSAAKTAIETGKIQIDGERTKPAKDIRIDQTVRIRRNQEVFEVVVIKLSQHRGPAKVAQTLYNETDTSVELRETARARRRMERAGLQVPATKPSKKQRRDLRKLKSTTIDE